jgi:hypothetical protein
LQVSGLTAEDVWPGIAHQERTLWTAELFLIVVGTQSSSDLQRTEYSTIIGRRPVRCDMPTIISAALWMQHMDASTTSGSDTTSLSIWRDSERVSLAKVLVLGDAIGMYNWRKLMSIWFRDEISGSEERSNVIDTTVKDTALLVKLTRLSNVIDFAVSRLQLRAVLPDGPDAANAARALLLVLWSARLVVGADGCFGAPIANRVMARQLQTAKSALSLGFVSSESQWAAFVESLCDSFDILWRSVPVSCAATALAYLRDITVLATPQLLLRLVCSVYLELIHFADDALAAAEQMWPRVPLILSYLCRNSGPAGDVNMYTCLSRPAVESIHQMIASSRPPPPPPLTAAEDGEEREREREREDSTGTAAAAGQTVGGNRRRAGACTSRSAAVVKILLEDIMRSSEGPVRRDLVKDVSLEDIAQKIISMQVDFSLEAYLSTRRFESAPLAPIAQHDPRSVHVVRVAARIDAAGGWSDTPPNCFQWGGAVSIITEHTVYCDFPYY